MGFAKASPNLHFIHWQDASSTFTGKMPVPLLLARCQFHFYWQDASSTFTGKMPVPLLLAGCQFHFYWQDASSTMFT
ncbi:MAG: hypothetical protein F6K47_32860 [Symploca sp. SIO2E6]|nr:hypothetical protein [Symploca sp. SIO2E6]